MKKPEWNDDISKYFKETKSDYKSYYLDKLKENEYHPAFGMEPKNDIMDKKYQKNRLSAQDRAQFARERRALEGSIITQKGFEGALVLEHIRGSQYLLRMPDGTEVFAGHTKQRMTEADKSISTAGWRLWDNGSCERY